MKNKYSVLKILLVIAGLVSSSVVASTEQLQAEQLQAEKFQTEQFKTEQFQNEQFEQSAQPSFEDIVRQQEGAIVSALQKLPEELQITSEVLSALCLREGFQNNAGSVIAYFDSIKNHSDLIDAIGDLYLIHLQSKVIPLPEVFNTYKTDIMNGLETLSARSEFRFEIVRFLFQAFVISQTFENDVKSRSISVYTLVNNVQKRLCIIDKSLLQIIRAFLVAMQNVIVKGNIAINSEQAAQEWAQYQQEVQSYQNNEYQTGENQNAENKTGVINSISNKLGVDSSNSKNFLKWGALGLGGGALAAGGAYLGTKAIVKDVTTTCITKHQDSVASVFHKISNLSTDKTPASQKITETALKDAKATAEVFALYDEMGTKVREEANAGKNITNPEYKKGFAETVVVSALKEPDKVAEIWNQFAVKRADANPDAPSVVKQITDAAVSNPETAKLIMTALSELERKPSKLGKLCLWLFTKKIKINKDK